MKKAAIAGIGGFVTGFYMVFVIQSLWNWFAVSVLRLPGITYWNLYGLLILIGAIRNGDSTKKAEDDIQWQTITTMVDVCVPYKRREELDHTLQAQTEKLLREEGRRILGKLAGMTFALVLGWCIHTFST